MNGFLENRLKRSMIAVNSNDLSLDVAVKLDAFENNGQKLLFYLNIIFLTICGRAICDRSIFLNETSTYAVTGSI